MFRAENQNPCFGALRGGMLIDDELPHPCGLECISNTTNTMLSVITNTAGVRPLSPKDFFDIARIDRHWNLMRLNTDFRDEILTLLKPFNQSPSAKIEADNPSLASFEQYIYAEIEPFVSPPNAGIPSLASFEQYVLKQTRSISSERQRYQFRMNITALKTRLDTRNLYTTDQAKRILFERKLLPCGATLVVVPNDAYFNHWAEHIRKHTNLEVVGDRHNPAIKRYCDEVRDRSYWDKGIAYIDLRLRAPFPTLNELMKCTIIVVSYDRIRECEYPYESYLLQFRWLRVVVDSRTQQGM